MLRYLDKDNLLPTFQSGFRKGHSTETLLVRLLSDIYGAIDRSQVILLSFLGGYLSLSTSFGLSGNFLDWIVSYLHHRSFSAVYVSTRTPYVPVPFGLPQESVLGPLL